MTLPRLATRLQILVIAALSLATAAVNAESDLNREFVRIDGFPVTAMHLAVFSAQTGAEPEQAEDQIRLLNELVNNFMIANSTEAKALSAHPEIVAALEVARARLLAQAFVRSELANAPVNEERIKAVYDAEFGAAQHTEVKARHILLNSRDAAAAAIKALDDGEDFSVLASRHSIGPTKDVGGDLGWIEPDAMEPEIAAALQSMADGTHSREPVKTRYGWHVILREQSRSVAPPALDSVRDEIERHLREEYVAQKILDIRQRANIEVQNPNDGG